jgi:peptidyl-prolyl cis-trans isomerase C
MAFRTRVSAGFAGIAALALVAALPVSAETPKADTVVASVNGTDITLGQMIALRDSLPPQYLAMPDDALFKGILEQLIQQQALADAVKDKVTDHDTLTLENQRLAFLASKALEEVASGAVSDEALQKLYDEKYGKAAPAKEYHARHILVETEDEAKALKAELDKGADFAKLAAEKSKDSSAQNGGDLGWFGLGMMVKPFEDAVVALEPGKISDPVKSEFGWHLIKLDEIRDATPPKLEDVKDELAGELQQKAVEARVTELTGAAKIDRKTDGMDPAILKDETILPK